MDSTGLTEAAFAIVAIGIAAMVRGYSGFGFSALSVASVSLIMPMQAIVPVVLMLEVAASVLMLPQAWRDVHWPTVVTLSIAACVGAPLGIWALAELPATAVRVSILSLILCASLALLANRKPPALRSRAAAVGVGLFAGMVNGAGAIGGLVFALFMVATELPPRVLRATLVALFLVIDLVATGMMLPARLLNTGHVTLLMMLLPSMAVGIHLGSRLFQRTNPASFRKFAILLLLLLATTGLVTSISEWMH